MKKDIKNTTPKKRVQPRMAWQRGEYDRHLDLKLVLPYQFLLLCKLLDVTPAQVLYQFMVDVDCSGWERTGREGARAKVMDYMLQCGYGQTQYTLEDIRQMFREMDSIGMLFPRNVDMEFLDLHTAWRDRYHDYWFEQWYGKLRRKI